MKENTNSESVDQVLPAVVKKKQAFSLIWFIPLLALVVGAWLLFKAVSEKGPVIEIQFRNAEGIEAGKTKVKFKNVDVGLVKSVHLNESLSNVVLSVQLNAEMEPYLTDKTRFWVVRARVGAGQVTGLGTLLSGAYLGIDPFADGKPSEKFAGLESPPTVTLDTPGRFYRLKAADLGSLHENSPVFFRRIQVGHVVNYSLSDDGKELDIIVFIEAPHHKKVFKTTKFWNAEGLDFKLDSTGVRVNTESLLSILAGGISFGNLESLGSEELAEENTIFALYESRSKVNEPVYNFKEYYVFHFEDSIRGLSVGAPVEYKGYKIGEVADIKMEFSARYLNFSTPVLVAIEPERFGLTDIDYAKRNEESVLMYLVRNGFRGQLRTGMLLTGQLYIDMDFYPDAAYAEIIDSEPYKELPTIRSSINELPDRMVSILKEVDKVPWSNLGNEILDTINQLNRIIRSDEVRQSIANLEASMENMASISAKIDQMMESKPLTQSAESLQKSLENIETLTASLNGQLNKDMVGMLSQGQKTFAAAENLIDENSPMMTELSDMIRELAQAAKSINELVDYLERHPDSLIFGKGVNK